MSVNLFLWDSYRLCTHADWQITSVWMKKGKEYHAPSIAKEERMIWCQDLTLYHFIYNQLSFTLYNTWREYVLSWCVGTHKYSKPFPFYKIFYRLTLQWNEITYVHSIKYFIKNLAWLRCWTFPWGQAVVSCSPCKELYFPTTKTIIKEILLLLLLYFLILEDALEIDSSKSCIRNAPHTE